MERANDAPMPLSRLQSAHLLGLRRAWAQAKRERDDPAAKFEEVIDRTRDELRGLRNDLSCLNQIEKALGVERDETRWLN
jgi:hypothetical protein